MSTPILPPNALPADKLEALRQLFPDAVQSDPDGCIRVNSAALQRAVDPSNTAGVRVEEGCGYLPSAVRSRLGRPEATIFEITAERIRRAGAKLQTEHAAKLQVQGGLLDNELPPLDTGFRVFELVDDPLGLIHGQALHTATQADVARMQAQIATPQTMDMQRVLSNLLLSEGLSLCTRIQTLVADHLFIAGDVALLLQVLTLPVLTEHLKSYMEALAALRPVLIIDEPHRFEGAVVQAYLPKFKPQLTLRFGATFRNDDYRNLIYTLDSAEAFRQRLVKGITVDTVAIGDEDAQLLCLREVTGGAGNRVAKVAYRTEDGRSKTTALRNKDNLGEKTHLPYLHGYVVENITAQELLFTNGFALPLGADQAVGMLAEDLQSASIALAVANHFEREEMLFKHGIKSLTLFFIDSVAKYRPDGQNPTPVRAAFEMHYQSHLEKTLAKSDLHDGYRAYLERSATDIAQVHKGYFAASHSDKSEEEAIALILKEKEKLLSFSTDLRFIFSMWALQEGWDNPNVFTLCKLAPSNSKISKLQQIGRGLRLAVNQNLERIPHDEPEFDTINDLMVVVPASEGDFVQGIQNDIAGRSLGTGDNRFDASWLVAEGAAPNALVAGRLLDKLAELGVVSLDDATGKAALVLVPDEFLNQSANLRSALAGIRGNNDAHTDQLMRWLGQYMGGAGRTKRKESRPPTHLHLDSARFADFKVLWDQINRDTRMHFELDTPRLIDRVLESIEKNFEVRPLALRITRQSMVQNLDEQHRAESPVSGYQIHRLGVFSLGEFVRALSNQTRLSIHTVTEILRRMSEAKFAQIANNENNALVKLRDLIKRSIYELLIQTVRYEMLELKVKTALTDNTGQLLKTIPVSLCGSELHAIRNSEVRALSLYADAVMPVDSDIERTTVDESQLDVVTVFAKLPRVNIPTPLGNYNPDFGYAVQWHGTRQALYLVVETKGYSSKEDIPDEERHKIDSAERFFKALQEQGVPVRFETKINRDRLGDLISAIVNNPQ